VSAQNARRWDPLVRFTRWGVAAGIVANAAFVREGGPAHVWIGCTVAGLLAARLVWGLIGTPRARFAAFPPDAAAAARHVGDIVAGRHMWHPSHNPLGALMAYALWATLAVVVATGIAMRQAEPSSVSPPGAEARVSAYVGEMEGDHDDGLEEVHEAAANLLFGLAALHLTGVAFETRRSGRGVVRAMVGGRRG
jgi:cytochrome b